MMRGEYYAPPPAPPKPTEKFRRRRGPVKAPAAMTDMLPSEDYGAGVDTFGFSTGIKKDDTEDEKQSVNIDSLRYDTTLWRPMLPYG